MPKFFVTLEELVQYEVELEAENEEAAKEAALDLWTHSEDPMEDFGGHGDGVEVINVEAEDDGDRILAVTADGVKILKPHPDTIAGSKIDPAKLDAAIHKVLAK